MSLNFSGNLTIININIMKKIIFFFFTLFSLFAFSQQTDFNYQAIIKGSNGMAISGQSVVMQFSIIYDAANGTVAYQETHTVNTSVDGLVNLVIGSGAPTNQTGDSWGAIDWGKPLFLKEEVNLGSGFATLGTGRIYAVPVANYAAKAGAIKGIISGAISTTIVTATHLDATSGSYASFLSGSYASFSGVVTASAFRGDGSGLTNLPSTGTPSTSIGLVEGDSFYLGQNPSSTTNNAQSNLSVGITALNAITTGDRNMAIGHNALTNNNTGQNNVAIGFRSQEANQDGEQNVSLGVFTLLKNNGGDWNTAIGMQALHENVTGDGNTAVGSAALRNNTASQNTAVGLQSMMNNTSGTANSALGYMSLEDNTTGARNTSVGAFNLDKNTTGSDNVAIGYYSMHTAETSNQNTAIGSFSMKNHTTGTLNAAIGYKSLEDNTTGNYNVAMGAQSLANNTTGNGNSAIGRAALFINTTGDDNTGSGYGALYSNTTGEENTADGSQSLYYSTTGLRNTGVGYRSLYTNTTGTNNTAVGHTADVGANNLVNATAIGYGAVAGASNSIQLGNSNVNLVKTSGVVSATGIITSGRVTATAFSGDGSGLTNLPSSGANNQIWISHALFERTGSQNIASKTGVFNGYYYEFLNLKKGNSGISQTRATFVPPSHWGNGNYKVTLYFLTENANSGNIQVDWGIQVLTMSGNNVSAGSDFIGNSDGAFQYGTTIGAPPSNLTAAAQTANNKRPLQKYTYTYNYNFSGIDFATLHMSRYLNQGYSYSDTYDGDFYVVGIKIEKNY